MEFYLEETSYFIWRTSTWFVIHLYLNILMIYMRIHLNHSLLVDCRVVCRESTHFGFPVHIYDVNINICHHSYILLNRFFHTSNPFFHLSATLRVDVYKFSVSITLFGPLFPLFNAMPGAGCYVFAAFVENLPSLSLYDWVVFRFTGKSIHFLNWKDHLHQGLLKWNFFYHNSGVAFINVTKWTHGSFIPKQPMCCCQSIRIWIPCRTYMNWRGKDWTHLT